MGITVLSDLNSNLNENDVVFRQRMEHSRVQDRKDVFTNETVTVSFGPKNEKLPVVLKYVKPGGRFAFAVFAENKVWQETSRQEWQAAASDALEKFCATKGAAITLGPRPEDTNRYNMMVETRDPIP